MEQKVTTAHSAITATATSSVIPVAGAKKITIELTEGGTVLNRSGALTITGSLTRGGDFRTINMLIDNVADAAGMITTIASKTRNEAGTDLLFLPAELLGLAEIKVVITITDGATPTGNFTAKVLVER